MFTFFNRILRIFQESFKGFLKDKCFLHAASLTFYTLLSIVPILAIAFGLAKGFGFETNLEEQIYSKLTDHKEIVDIVLQFSRSLLKEAESSFITGIGVIFLFLFVISLFWSIEASMNDIWKVKRSRPLFRIITDYLAMMILCPFIFVIASSLIVFVTSQIDVGVDLLYKGITLLLIWILFTCIYIVMPNTRVSTKYALWSGIFAGTVYYLVLVAVIKFQIGVSQYNAVYGSLAALPLFLFWLQISWLLVLFGAELAYHSEQLHLVLKYSGEKIEITTQQLAILLAHRIIQDFKFGEKQCTLNSLVKEFGVPEDTIQKALNPLKTAHVILEVKADNYETYYLPARNIDEIRLHTIINNGNPLVAQKLMINRSDNLEIILKKISDFEADIMNLKSNVPLL